MSVRETNDVTIRGLLTQVDGILSGVGIKRAPGLFSAGDLPKSCVDSSYCVALQTQDTNLFREGGEESARVLQTLTLSVLKQLRPMAQFESMCEAGDIEEKIMSAMLRRSNFPYAVVKYVGTQRTPTTSREYLVLELSFTLEHDWSWSGIV